MEHYADHLVKLIKNKKKTKAIKFTIEWPGKKEKTSMGCYQITFIPTFEFHYLSDTKVFAFRFLVFEISFWIGSDLSDLT